jgi:hypothetical protein
VTHSSRKGAPCDCQMEGGQASHPVGLAGGSFGFLCGLCCQGHWKRGKGCLSLGHLKQPVREELVSCGRVLLAFAIMVGMGDRFFSLLFQ